MTTDVQHPDAAAPPQSATVTTTTSTVSSPTDATPLIFAKRDALILRVLAIVLVLFTMGSVAVGVAGMFHVALDPQAVNATREDMKTYITYILGVFSGLVQQRLAASLQAPRP